MRLSQQFNKELNKINSGKAIAAIEAIESPDPPLRGLVKPRPAGICLTGGAWPSLLGAMLFASACRSQRGLSTLSRPGYRPVPMGPVVRKPVGQLTEGVDEAEDKVWFGKHCKQRGLTQQGSTCQAGCCNADEDGSMWDEEGTTCLVYRKPKQPRASKLEGQEEEPKPTRKRLRPMPGPAAKRPAVDEDDEDLFGGCSSAIRNCPQSQALPPRSAASCSQVQCS